MLLLCKIMIIGGKWNMLRKIAFLLFLLTLLFSGVNLQPTLATTDLSFE